MCLEALAPGRAGIGKKDIDFVRCFLDLGYETLDLGDARDVGWDRDCAGIGVFGGEGVKGGYGFVAGGGFAGGDVDFRGAGLEETGGKRVVSWAGRGVYCVFFFLEGRQ